MLKLCVDRFAIEKPNILIGLPRYFSGLTITGDSNMKTIQLTQNKVALVDDEDYEWLNQWKWSAHSDGWNYYDDRNCYCPLVKQHKLLKMHRVIMKAKKGQCIDHIDHNGLNNQKNNLRFVTPSQNQHNSRNINNTSSIYKGVDFCKANKKWRARIAINKKTVHIGYYKNEIDAAKAYNKKAIEHFGEFANINKF